MPEPISAARREAFALWIDAPDEEAARAKALSWAIAEPSLREPAVASALPRVGVTNVWTVTVDATVVLERRPGWYRLPIMPGGRLDLSALETELEIVLLRYALGGRAEPLRADVLDAARRYIEGAK